MNNLQERARQIADDYVLWGQSEVVEELIAAGAIDAETAYPFNDDEESPLEVLEWWLVTPWLARRLQEQGEHIVEALGCRWWGRTTSGQAIYMDEVILQICKEFD